MKYILTILCLIVLKYLYDYYLPKGDCTCGGVYFRKKEVKDDFIEVSYTCNQCGNKIK